MARKKKGQATPDAPPPEGKPTGSAASSGKRQGKGTTASGNGCRTTGKAKAQTAKQIAAEQKMRENQREALDYRKQGFTYAEIAEAMDVSTATAHRWVTDAIANIPKEAAEDVLQMQLERLDAMMQKCMENFMDSGSYGDMEMILKLEDRRARLLGLYKDGRYGGEADEVFKAVGERMAEQMELDRPVLRIEHGTPLPASPIL